MLQQVYQEQTLSRSTVFLWHKRFKEGCEDVENDPRGGRPSTSRNETIFDVRGMVHNEFLPHGADCQSACLQRSPATFASLSKRKKVRFVGKQHVVASSQ